MIRFLLKRYSHAISVHRHWMMLSLLPLFIYWIFAAGGHDRFAVAQKISISKSTPILLSPLNLKTMGDIVIHPEIFFQDKFALSQLNARISRMIDKSKTDSMPQNSGPIVENGMSLTMPTEDSARISYFGKNRRMGEALVEFYSHRLLQKAKQGIKSSNNPVLSKNHSASLIKGNTEQKSQGTVQLLGDMEIEEHRALWRSDRLPPSVWIFSVSLVLMLILLGIYEWMDSSYKSERQIARSLELPILGSMPDLREIKVTLSTTVAGPNSQKKV